MSLQRSVNDSDHKDTSQEGTPRAFVQSVPLPASARSRSADESMGYTTSAHLTSRDHHPRDADPVYATHRTVDPVPYPNLHTTPLESVQSSLSCGAFPPFGLNWGGNGCLVLQPLLARFSLPVCHGLGQPASFCTSAIGWFMIHRRLWWPMHQLNVSEILPNVDCLCGM